MIGKLLSVAETIWICQSVFSTLNFRNSKYRLILANENLASVVKCVVNIKHTLDFED
jgi:hypothetical protein